MLFGFLTREKREAKARLVEDILFEAGAVPLAIATAILQAAPERERNVAALRNLLSAIPKAQKEIYIDRVVHRFALYVMDLAASERNHHARPYGLVEHSLEVARLALERAQDQRFVSSHDPVVNHEMQPRWVYAVFISALLHDVGKVADVVVAAPDGLVWNPFVEPLAAFYHRHRLAPGEPSRIRYRPGRSLEGHVLHNPYFHSAVLPVEAREYLGRVQSHICLEQSEAYATLKALVGQADKLSASRDIAIHGLDCPGGGRRDASEIRESALWHYFADGFRRAIEEGLLVADRLDGHVFYGERHAALSYPGGVVLAIQMLRRIWDMRAPELQAYTADEAGARKLLHQFAHHGWVFLDRESGSWSFDCAIQSADGSRSAIAVLLPKDRLAPDAKPSSFALSFSNRETHRDVGVADFFAKHVATNAVQAAGSTAEATHVDAGPVSALPAARTVPPAPAPIAPRREFAPPAPAPMRPPAVRSKAPPPSEEDLGVDAVTIMTDVRNALRTGGLTVNIRRADVYLTSTHAHVILPIALDKVAGPRGYPVLPSDALNAFLNLLGRHPLVEHRPGGEVLWDVFTFADAMKPVHTLRIKLAGWLSKEEIERYGFWGEPVADATPTEKDRRAARRRPA